MNIDKSLFSPEAQTLIDFLQSADWPEAAPAFLICQNTEEDKTERAEGIINYIAENFTNKKFCDFGCGEGHVAREAGKIAGYSIGYDVVKDGTLPWESTEYDYSLTTDFEKIKQNGPYDIILLYDVLDHVKSPEDVLKQVASISNANTKIFVRFHPWIGRHGGHLYKDLNKAWAHLVFTEEELLRRSEFAKTKKNSPETRAKISKSNKGREGRKKTKEEIEKMLATKRRNGTLKYGKKNKIN